MLNISKPVLFCNVILSHHLQRGSVPCVYENLARLFNIFWPDSGIREDVFRPFKGSGCGGFLGDDLVNLQIISLLISPNPVHHLRLGVDVDFKISVFACGKLLNNPEDVSGKVKPVTGFKINEPVINVLIVILLINH